MFAAAQAAKIYEGEGLILTMDPGTLSLRALCMKILPSQRAHLYILDRARVFVRHGRIEYISDEGREPKTFNIPVANTAFVLLGQGTSITQDAARKFASEGVCFGFCGTGGTPLLAAEDPYPDILLPASEYRDPRPLQRWIEVWRVPEARLAAAKTMMADRMERIETVWPELELPIDLAPPGLRDIKQWRRTIKGASDITPLLGEEGNITKTLYRHAAQRCGVGEFTRNHQETGGASDPNSLLNHGNYLAYGIAAVVLWALGLPASLAAVHGKTRRGGLVFDLADTIKDSIILPTAFSYATAVRNGVENAGETGFRELCIQHFDDHKVLPMLFASMERAIAAGEAVLPAQESALS